jgi:hypothetical protein
VEFTVVRPPFYVDFCTISAKILIKNEREGISKFCWIKSCAQVLALISNHPELCSSFIDKALGILLEAIYDP